MKGVGLKPNWNFTYWQQITRCIINGSNAKWVCLIHNGRRRSRILVIWVVFHLQTVLELCSSLMSKLLASLSNCYCHSRPTKVSLCLSWLSVRKVYSSWSRCVSDISNSYEVWSSQHEIKGEWCSLLNVYNSVWSSVMWENIKSQIEISSYTLEYKSKLTSYIVSLSLQETLF